MRLLYSLFIRIYTIIIHASSLVNDKAKLWINGRKDWRRKLQEIDFGNKQVFWFHCASLGEFEQGRPLIEALKAATHNKILLTFFSPSGFELRKDYAHADWVLYLPADTLSNAKYFVSEVKPKAAFFIKYEFWFNYLYVLKQSQTPAYLISGIFRNNQHFFAWYGSWFAKQLSAFDYFFVQNENSIELLKKIGHHNASITGDTRFDRVLQIMHQKKSFKELDLFCENAIILVAGSTYFEDETALHFVMNNFNQIGSRIKIIIAPHQVNDTRINEIERLFGKNDCVRYTQFKENMHARQVLIIDTIGMLSSLYAYANIAYIGGGLNKGIHNTLEAAVYGIPLIFGNNFKKFDEAVALVKNEAAFVINDKETLNQIIHKLIREPDYRKYAGLKSSNYVKSKIGAVNKILTILESKKMIVKN